MLKQICVVLFLILFTGTTQAGKQFFEPNGPLCNVAPLGWKDRKNHVARGYEYCVVGTAYQKVVNLMQTPIYVSVLGPNKGKVFKIEGQSIFESFGISSTVFLLTETDGAFYRTSNALVVGSERNGKETKRNYQSNLSNLRQVKGKEVPPFRVKEITFESSIYMGGILDDFGSKYNQRAWGTVLPAIIGGAGAGGLGAWDADKACGGDIVRGMFIGGVTAGLGATIFATGAGAIVTPIAMAAVNKSLTAVCSQCHKSTCETDSGRH